MRYAIAGGVVFGLARMVTQLKDVQQQLGLMQAIGSPGGQVFSDQGITRLGNSLQKSAMDALTPINEINDATINLLSTVQNVPQSDIPNIITDIGKAAKLSQTPVEDLTKAAATMNIAFGRANNAKTISQFTRMWFGLIQEAPGGVSAAPEISNQLSPLASMFALGQGPVAGNVSQAQMLGDTLAVLRTGATPSTALRGLTYLLQSIIQPTGKSRKALASIGITAQSIEREGVQANLMKFLNTITNTGNTRKIAGMSDETVDTLDSTNGNLPGIPAAEMVRLRSMIPRIHGIRAAVILAGQLRSTSQRKSLEQDIQLMMQEQNNQVDDVHNMARAWEDFRKRSRLQEATIAINTMRLQVAQAFEPVFNLAARGVTGIGTAAQHHRKATEIAALGLLGVGGVLGIRRFLTGGGGNTIARAEAIRDIGSAGSGNSPENPLYVIVVGQLFNNKSGKGLVDDLKKVAPGATGVAAEAGASFAGIAAASLLPLSITGFAYYMSQRKNQSGGISPNFNKKTPFQQALDQHFFGGGMDTPLSASRYPRIQQFFSAMGMSKQSLIDPNWLRVMHQFQAGQISAGKFDKMLARADVYMEIDVNKDGKTTTHRVHIPADFFKYSNGKVPSTRGKKAVKNG